MSEEIPRGAIKRFREHLNREGELIGQKWGNGRYQQRSRPYGDYLYAQDREKFMFDLREWLATNSTP